jgi:hypothetical protein
MAMVAAMLFLIAACGANFSKNTYRALAIQANAYDAAMSSAGDLYKAGKIDDALKAKIISAATAFKDSYDNAIDKMVAYEKSPPAAKDAAMQQAQIAAEVVAKLFGNLQAILGPLGVELVEP